MFAQLLADIDQNNDASLWENTIFMDADGILFPPLHSHFTIDIRRIGRSLSGAADSGNHAGQLALPKRGAPAQPLPGQYRAATGRTGRYGQRAARAAQRPAAEP